jgi:hypothetical protein
MEVFDKCRLTRWLFLGGFRLQQRSLTFKVEGTEDMTIGGSRVSRNIPDGRRIRKHYSLANKAFASVRRGLRNSGRRTDPDTFILIERCSSHGKVSFATEWFRELGPVGGDSS